MFQLVAIVFYCSSYLQFLRWSMGTLWLQPWWVWTLGWIMSSESWPVTVLGWESPVPRLLRSEQKMLVSMLVWDLFQTGTEIESTEADHTSSILPSSVTSITFIPHATLKPIPKTHPFIHKFLRDGLKVEGRTSVKDSLESFCDENLNKLLMLKHTMKNPNQSSAGSMLISSLGFCPQCLTQLPLMSEAEEVPNRN